jgi:L-asparaginase II
VNDILCEVRRGPLVESVHRGAIAVVNGPRILYRRGPVGDPVFMRSCAKPFQSATVVGCGAADAFGFAPDEIAVMSGSHLGEPEQVGAVKSILDKAGISPEALRCGVHPPISPRGLSELHRAGGPPTVLHNNCSGKHAGMAAASKHMGAAIENYLDPGHPLQRANLRLISEFAGVRAAGVRIGIDGCSAPTFGLPLGAIARAVSGFISGDGPARRVREAMMAHPAMVGRPCAQLMSAAPGRILGKVGAEGVYVCGLPARGVGIALKVADGNVRAVLPVLAALFRKLRLLDRMDLEAVAKAADPVLRNHAGIEVGEIRVRL